MNNLVISNGLITDELKLKKETNKAEIKQDESFKNYLNHELWSQLTTQVNLNNLQNFARFESLVEHNTSAQKLKDTEKEIPPKTTLQVRENQSTKNAVDSGKITPIISMEKIPLNNLDENHLYGQKIKLLPNTQTIVQQPLIKPICNNINVANFTKNVPPIDNHMEEPVKEERRVHNKAATLLRSGIDLKELKINNDQENYAEKYEWLQTVIRDFKFQLRQQYPHIYVPLVHPNLGGVDIHLKFKKDGRITADFATDSKELLTLLTQNRQNFEVILEQPLNNTRKNNNLINFHLKTIERGIRY